MVFFPAARVMLVLYLTGLFYLPYKTKWARAGKPSTSGIPRTERARPARLPEIT